MKTTTRALAAIVLLFAGVFAAGCTMKDGDETEKDDVQTEMDDVETESECEEITDVVWVDLGLPSGLLWADRNVGADTPEEYGDYCAWGEKGMKEVYNFNYYGYCVGYFDKLTKYCNNPEYGNDGFTDTLTTLQPEDDVARQRYGGKAHVPTKQEWQELIDNTTYEWAEQDGVAGYLFTSMKNGSTLFLPAAGGHWDNWFDEDGSYGYYWSSSLDPDDPAYALRCSFNPDTVGVQGDERAAGFTVRAVQRR